METTWSLSSRLPTSIFSTKFFIDPPPYRSSTPHPIPPHVGGGECGSTSGSASSATATTLSAHPGRRQPRRFRPAHRQVQVLDRLAGRALHQVVQGREEDRAAGRRSVDGDPA